MIANYRIAAVWRANLMKICQVSDPKDIEKDSWVSHYVQLLDLGISLFRAKHGQRKLLMPALVLDELGIQNMLPLMLSCDDHTSLMITRYFDSVTDLGESQIKRILKKYLESGFDHKSIDSMSRDALMGQHILDLPYMRLVLREAMTPQIEHSLRELDNGQ